MEETGARGIRDGRDAPAAAVRSIQAEEQHPQRRRKRRREKGCDDQNGGKQASCTMRSVSPTHLLTLSIAVKGFATSAAAGARVYVGRASD